jgi:energy-coupling factor transport system substrate-specific component
MAETKAVAKKRRSVRIPVTFVVTLIPVAAALNIVGGYIAKALQLPIFLDMIGTAVTAIVLGPWWGALVGVITNVVSSFISGPISLPFAICNVVGALVWGYFHIWGWSKKNGTFFLTNVVCAVLVSAAATPIYVFIFGGATGHFADMMTAAFLAMGQNLLVSVFSSNILVSLADKIVAGYVALAIIDALPENLTANVKLPQSEGLKKIIIPIVGIVIGVAVMLIAMALAG